MLNKIPKNNSEIFREANMIEKTNNMTCDKCQSKNIKIVGNTEQKTLLSKILTIFNHEIESPRRRENVLLVCKDCGHILRAMHQD